ncbi:MAG: hypothetical protein AUK03_13265 [Anaerolineae bacterium CG2_30_64_16]|nr:MAG: hypothetical protein AUK03_13265 [Anaerolineae bacterium CG2_30_64_16]
MSEAETRMLLIRHGHNAYLTDRRMAGWIPGVHLDAQGQTQVAALGQRLASTAIAAVYSSPLERTVETAEAVAAPHHLPVVPVEEIGETHCGEWTGQSIEALRQTDAWRQVQRYPSGSRFPGGESVTEMQARMIAALDGLRAAHEGQTIAVVSHSDPIKVALAHYIGLHLDLFHRLIIHPASITELIFTATGPRLLRCNDYAHLPAEMGAA